MGLSCSATFRKPHACSVEKWRWSCLWVEFPSDLSSPRRTPKSYLIAKKLPDTMLPLGGVEGAPPTVLCPGLGPVASLTRLWQCQGCDASSPFRRLACAPWLKQPPSACGCSANASGSRNAPRRTRRCSRRRGKLPALADTHPRCRESTCNSAEDKTLTLINRLRYNVESLVSSGS